MTQAAAQNPQDDSNNNDVKQIIKTVQNFIAKISRQDFEDGNWKNKLGSMVVNAYNKNARAEYFQKKYPGLATDDLANALINVHAQMAALLGGSLGAIPLPLIALPAQIVGDMVSLSFIQMNLLLDLAVVYDLEFDREDPEDMFRLFKYALGFGAVEGGANLVGQRLVPNSLDMGVRHIFRGEFNTKFYNISKKLFRSPGTPLKAAKGIGQKKILKFGLPGASIAIAGVLNYFSVRAVGSFAKNDFKRYGIDELRAILHSDDSPYPPVFPAALKYLALADGVFTDEEKQLFRSTLVRISVDEHTPTEFDKLIASEGNLLNAIDDIESEELRHAILEVLKLMTVIDGKVHQSERDFLTLIAEKMEATIDFEALEKQAEGFADSQ